MPQDGSNNYQYPPGTPGIPDQTIESEAYNTFLDDLVTNDLNFPRPIHRGGTGAADATQALINLGGEKSSQVVTNYDTHVFLSGSFYSAGSATNSPVAGHAFAGIAYTSDAPATPPANLNVIVEARDQNDTAVPGRLYLREKKAGVWGPWKTDAASSSGATPPTTGLPDGALFWNSTNGVLYVNYNDGNSTQLVQAVALPAIDTSLFALKPDVVLKAGDTMTGLLTLSGEPTANLHAATKLYVDAGVGGVGGGLSAKVGKTGGADGIMTGLLTLSGDPTAVLHAATKQYVDARSAATLIINGDFRVNQLGYVSAAVLSAGTYGHDQWKAGASGGDYSFTQLKSSTQITIASGKSLIQPIEDANVAGGSYVLSWTGTAQARAGVNTLTPSGSYAASPLLITGQTAGTVMSVEFNTGTLGAVKLESGAIATPFLMRPFDQELLACQRYWYATNAANPKGVGVGSVAMVAPAGNCLAGSIKWAVRMRSVPTITIWGNGVQNNLRRHDGAVFGLTPVATYQYQDGCSFLVYTTGLTPAASYDFDIIADARL